MEMTDHDTTTNRDTVAHRDRVSRREERSSRIGLSGHVDDRRIPLVALATLFVALVAWMTLVSGTYPVPVGSMAGASEMGSMAGTSSMSEPGVPEAMALAAGLAGIVPYLVMWGIMMVAMMYPSAAGPFQSYVDRLEVDSKAIRYLDVAIVVGIYTIVWALVGVVPLAFSTVVPIATLTGAQSLLVLGVALIVLSAFQLSGFKRRWLFRCRSPVLSGTVTRRGGVGNAVRSGWRYSRIDVGSCGPMMAVLVIVGSMNLTWMAVITAVILLEHSDRWGFAFARGVGVVSGLVGMGIIVAALV